MLCSFYKNKKSSTGEDFTVDTSLRLAKFFGVSDDYFISLQDDIDIRNLKIEIASELEKIKTFVPV